MTEPLADPDGTGATDAGRAAADGVAIDRTALRQLVGFEPGDGRVLSTYLDLEPSSQVTGAYRIVFKDLVKEVRQGLDRKERKQFDEEVERVAAWLQDERPPSRGLAVFSCQPRGLWQTLALRVPVTDTVMFEPRPALRPLAEVLEDHERTLVAVVDKSRARFFVVALGEIEEREAFTDDVPGKHDQGGLAQARLQRHHETHVLWHLKRVVERLEHLLAERPTDRLILGGPVEATSELRELLPPLLSERLAATIDVETTARDGEILAAATEVERRIERDAEEARVRTILELAPAGGAASCGPEETLEAIWLREVMTLVAADGLRTTGGECPVDGRLTMGDAGPCPVCGTPTVPLPDLVERAVELTIGQDGHAEIAHEEPGRLLSDRCGGLGALLRFRVEPAEPVG
jgi:peptide chain release factor subunit 1